MQNFIIYKFDIANIHLTYQDDIVTTINFVRDKDINDYGKPTEFTDLVFNELQEYFIGKRKEFTFKYVFHGTDFQKKVWKALCDIPYGQTRSYKQIAMAIGNEKACRAVGMANNKNPISIVVPCHRVIGSGGKLVGYGGGLDIKEYLLNLEMKFK